MGSQLEGGKSALQAKLFEVIFGSHTVGGKVFDIVLILSIVVSVIAVMLESLRLYRVQYGEVLVSVEWFFTILFTVEYILRLSCVRRPLRYAMSFFGIVDLVAILPTYVGIIDPDFHYFLVVRILRVLRVFRILKLAHYIEEANVITRSLYASRQKLIVFFATVLTLVVIFGSMMYVVEGEENGFTSIPVSIYWAIVTLTTVGYGDLSPATGLGKALSSAIMLLGYAMLAVPTGIVTAEMHLAHRLSYTVHTCPKCGRIGHTKDAVFCKYCSEKLQPETGESG